MYAGVPTKALVRVRAAAPAPSPPPPPAASAAVSCASRARPKSITRTLPSFAIIAFCGLKSRWMTPAAWAAASPRAAATKTSRIARQLRGSVAQPLFDGRPVDQLHRDEHTVAERTGVVDTDDVRMREARDGPRLAQQAIAAVGGPLLGSSTTFTAMRRSRSG